MRGCGDAAMRRCGALSSRASVASTVIPSERSESRDLPIASGDLHLHVQTAPGHAGCARALTMHTLIENGELYAPKHLGSRSLLLADSRIAAVGRVNRDALESLGVEYDIVDA